MKSFVFVLLMAAPCFGQITVSEALPMPVQYPPEVYQMTDDEFFKWATEFNKEKRKELEERRAQIKEPEFIEGVERQVTRGSCFAGNCAFAAFGLDSSPQVTELEFPRRWRNPFYYGPGPLIIINPYCRPIR